MAGVVKTILFLASSALNLYLHCQQSHDIVHTMRTIEMNFCNSMDTQCKSLQLNHEEKEKKCV